MEDIVHSREKGAWGSLPIASASRVVTSGRRALAGSFVLPLGACITSVPVGPAARAPSSARSESVGPSLSECPAGVIDDLEDGNSQILTNEERGGYWYTYSDSMGTTVAPEDEFVPSSGGANQSAKAAHIWGKKGDQ